MTHVIVLVVALLTGLGAAGAADTSLSGVVVGVHDGDTLTLLTTDHRQIHVRLTEIDAPEAGQPWGRRSKEALSALTFGRAVKVRVQGEDRYGRSLGRVYLGPTDVSAELVRSGSAWVYRRYTTEPSFAALEAAAKTKRVGLWSLPDRDIVPPWDWRAGRRASVRPTSGRIQPPQSGAPACGAKRYCREMTSCAEAQFYLRQCGVSRLDGDGDGVPCEALCR